MDADLAKPATGEDAVSLTRDGPVAVLAMPARPGDRVKLTPSRLAGLARAVEAVSRDADAALLLLFGGAREFCLGADLGALRASDRAAAEAYLAEGQRVLASLGSLPVPCIAAIGGLALGGGFELALACDLRWAHRRAAFALPEAEAGVVPAWGAASALARELPGAQAWELLLGGRIGAGRAAELGLVGRVFEGPDFEAEARDAARSLAGLGRPVLAGLKEVWRAARSGGGEAARAEREACLARLAASKGRQEAGEGT
jgi:enoyl-CoA hydratase/carnithine racemase